MTADPRALRDAVIAACKDAGFHRVGIVPVAPSARTALYRDWLAAGHHGEMAYLATEPHLAGRADVRAVLPEARTVIVVALAYGGEVLSGGPVASPSPVGSSPDGPPSRDARLPIADVVSVRGVIARYARGTDYHLIVRDRLQQVAAALEAVAGPVPWRVCVDAAPVSERELAERAGLGFAAKNTMLIAPGLGSYVVLGELVVGAELAPTEAEPMRPRCGGCRACLDACPTGAFVDAYVLDARRCIAYLTIEHDGPIPRELRAAIGRRIFGCDVCQEVCPWNAAERATPAVELTPRDLDHAAPDLIRLAAIGANQLRGYVKRTALRRIDRPRLQRNVAVALGNSADARALPALVALLGNPHPLVRGHAAWGLAELAASTPEIAVAAAAALTAAPAETDAFVVDELAAARARVTSPSSPSPPRAA